MRKIRVLFVCLGNICRSPTAEGVFRDQVARAGLADSFEIDSAGTSGWHQGEGPDSRSQREALRHGVDISRQRSRALNERDFHRFDYLVAMDRANLREMRKRCPEALQGRLHLFTDFAPEFGADEVPDPYYGGPKGFEHVFNLCSACAEGLLSAIQRERATV